MKTISENRKSSYNYTFIEDFTAGICLLGPEVKSIRQGHVNISDAYCYIDDNGECWIKNMYIKQYEQSGYIKFDSYRDRKLLLKKHEIRKLSQKVSQKGCTIVPKCLVITDNGLIKVRIFLVKGKNSIDKRQSIKERDIQRDVERSLAY